MITSRNKKSFTKNAIIFSYHSPRRLFYSIGVFILLIIWLSELLPNYHLIGYQQTSQIFGLVGASTTPIGLVTFYTNDQNSDKIKDINSTSSSNEIRRSRGRGFVKLNSTSTILASTSPSTPDNRQTNPNNKPITPPSSSDNPGFEDLPLDLTSNSNINNSNNNDNNHNANGPLDHDEKPYNSITNVYDCKGRVRLTGSRGFITDGPGFYPTNLQCIWLIDSGRNNATIRLTIHQFNTECNYDFLYIFDGDSIYSPLVAALSGDMRDLTTSLTDIKPENTISNNNSYSADYKTNDTPTAIITTDSSYSINLAKQNATHGQAIPPSVLFSIPNVDSAKESFIFDIRTYSGKAFIYFHSDTAQSMPGFHVTYNIDSCPLDCSYRGDCDYSTLKCKCNSGYHGDGCQYISCPNNCTSPQNGYCDQSNYCICNDGYYGSDCSMRSDHQIWVKLKPISNNISQDNASKEINIDTKNLPARALHQAIIVDRFMYIIGGRSRSLSNSNIGIFRKKQTSTIFNYDLDTKVFKDLRIIGTTGIDHLAELTGHSLATKGSKIFIFGGMAMNNTILNSLSVFDTKTNTLANLVNERQMNMARFKISSSSSIGSEFAPPLAVVGHSANIIDSHMYIFLGYHPIFGYVNLVQKFNLADNSWSFVSKKGSSIPGQLGHTTTYDPVNRLVYLYGGHNGVKSNHLYSFDPTTEVWTFLQQGPSHRYYHSSVILNNQLIVLGGNSYNLSYQSDKCYQQSYLVYDLSCSKSISSDQDSESSSARIIMNQTLTCGRKCWHSVEDTDPNVLKRMGHSVVLHDNQLILYGGFNGIIMNDLRIMNMSSCESFTTESDCLKTKIGLSCHWDSGMEKCTNSLNTQFNASLTTDPEVAYTNCTKSDARLLQHICENRETCSDCLNTNLGCVWCGFLSRCNYNKCKSTGAKPIQDPQLCYADEHAKTSLIGISLNAQPLKDLQTSQDVDHVMECKRLENCYSCHSSPRCAWHWNGCSYESPSLNPESSSIPSHGISSQDEMNDALDGGTSASAGTQTITFPSNNAARVQISSANSSRYASRYDPFHRTETNPQGNSILTISPNTCDLPCFMRGSCNECTTGKCIWCSTTEQCIESSAYFAYHAMGQCMHYVAYMPRCAIANCVGIETCDKCLSNPKCGWLNDISNTGRGRCIEGTSAGPIFGNVFDAIEDLQSQQLNRSSTELTGPASAADSFILQNWYYTTCPSCQCNGHSQCRLTNSSVCNQPCQDFTEGTHCERCIQGYHGDPINGGVCKPCECNGRASSCNRETGKCYCSTKGIVGHNCNKCDDQNHYLGDLSAQGNGTCYYSLTTDFQYTFNMSKTEDHYYNDINFINMPLRKDSDLDFTIACSRPALVNITSGTSFKNRKPIHTGLECGSFRLRFPHDRHVLSETNYSFFVHVYNFQTPLVLQIAFSQHRTLYLPQFFFTFSSCFLFFFALSGIVWKLKHEYDIYVRRQRQFIEMEQMASRPFSTVLLELFKPKLGKDSELEALRPLPEPTPISFEPCFGNNVGVMSVFVQLPGRPNLAIGSALVTLNDEFSNTCDDNNSNSNKQRNSHKQQKDQQASV